MIYNDQGKKIPILLNLSSLLQTIVDVVTMTILSLIGKGLKVIYLKVHVYETKLIICGLIFFLLFGIIESFVEKYVSVGCLLVELFFFIPIAIANYSTSLTIINAHTLIAETDELITIFKKKNVLLKVNLFVFFFYVVMYALNVILTYCIPVNNVIYLDVIDCITRIMCMIVLTGLLQARKYVFDPLEIDKQSYIDRISQTLNNYTTVQKLFKEFNRSSKQIIQTNQVKLIGRFTQPLDLNQNNQTNQFNFQKFSFPSFTQTQRISSFQRLKNVPPIELQYCILDYQELNNQQ